MEKMWSSFYAIGLMLIVVILMTFVRERTSGWLRHLLTFIAVLLFIPIILFSLYALLGPSAP